MYARFGHDQRAGLAFKESQSKLCLKPAYLLGHCCLRHAKFFRCQPEIQMSRDDFKNTQTIERGKPFHELNSIDFLLINVTRFRSSR
jgi:hypothetical protein